MTTQSKHLTRDEADAVGRELDALRQEVIASLGPRDVDHIRRTIRAAHYDEAAGRLLLHFGIGPFSFVAGVAALSVAKILENMEIGHNVMHGQWDWMNDPAIHSSSWEWDTVCPSSQWKHSHNVVHHTWTNVLERDHDVGYQIMRVSAEQPWRPSYLLQPLYNVLLAALFQWGVAVHDIDADALRERRIGWSDIKPLVRGIAKKASKQVFKDYVFFPALAGPFFFWVLGANAVANLIRNLWSYAIIFCGHFPDGAHVFHEQDIANETRAAWRLRQILGSCNIEGGPLFHVMSGNLSFQIEHHLFPDLPSNRYAEAAVRVKALCEKHGIPYNSGSFARQLGTTFRTIFRLSLPNEALA